MFSNTAAVAFVGLAASSLISAAPLAGKLGRSWSDASSARSAASASSSSGGSPSTQYSLPPFPTEVNQKNAFFEFPLSNQFPANTEVVDIQNAAGGTLPNGAPPPTISAEGVTNLQLIAFNELFEVAFFTELLQNITNNVPGYDSSANIAISQVDLIDILATVQAQEELHALNASGALTHFGQTPISPCEYVFPVDTLDGAIALAQTFTDVVLGTLQDVIVEFGENGDAAFTRGIASVVGQEGEQNGFFRLFQGKQPSAQPFLTASTRDFAFNALQGFVVPGSCPDLNAHTINLTQFDGPLNVLTSNIPAENTEVQFSFANNGSVSTEDLQLVLINGQNLPISEAITNIKTAKGVTTFTAAFPFADDILFGLTIAAVTAGPKNFTSVDDVATVTLFGPGLIEML